MPSIDISVTSLKSKICGLYYLLTSTRSGFRTPPTITGQAVKRKDTIAQRSSIQAEATLDVALDLHNPYTEILAQNSGFSVVVKY
ncbi:hypothetical protein J6590_091953 [Homalodisca vitripennis]|nr:hypothetical protein J6590_091953 [Homalodisca vitripennis]